jgi:hypothetical protein
MKIIQFPFRTPENTASAYHNNTQSLGHGFFPVGTNKFWHGGVHLSVPHNEPIRAVADGEIIAWRIDSKPHTYKRGLFQGDIDFNTGFVLIKHSLPSCETKEGTETTPANVATFYSMYLHLEGIDKLQKRPIPPFFLSTTRIPCAGNLHDDVEIKSTYKNDVISLCEILHRPSGIVGWLETDAIDTYRSHLKYAIASLYKTKPILDKTSIPADRLNIATTTPITVLAGDIIGYAGKASTPGQNESIIHFEILLQPESLDGLFNNVSQDVLGLITLDADYELFTKYNKAFQGEKYQFNTDSQFLAIGSCGKNGMGGEQAVAATRLWSLKGEKFYGPLSMKFHSQADWRSEGWTKIQDPSRFSKKGLIATDEIIKRIDTNNDNTLSLTEIQQAREYLQKLAILHPSEWDSRTNDDWYSDLKNGKNGLPNLGDSFQPFLQHVVEQQFMQELAALPSDSASAIQSNSLWHLSPIGFLDQLRATQRTDTSLLEEDFVSLIRETFTICIELLKVRKSQLEDWSDSIKRRMKIWIGDESEYARGILTRRIERIQKIIPTLKHQNFVRATSNKNKASNYATVRAYVYPDDTLPFIYTGTGFAQMPARSYSDLDATRCGIIFHELSHLRIAGGSDGSTLDHAYFRGDCLSQAKRDPSKALFNADSFQFFMTDEFEIK